MAVAFITVFGLVMGSFLTVVTERLDTVESFWFGRSKCNHCKQVLSWWELIPFLGFLLVRGKCIRCHKQIPKLYPFFEVLTALAFLAIWLGSPRSLPFGLLLLEFGLASLLLVLCFYDWLNQLFPARLLYAALIVVLVTALGRGFFAPETVPTVQVHEPFFAWLNSPQAILWYYAAGLVAGAGLLGLLAFPSRGRWMGYGDVILGAILGVWLGYPFILLALALAFYLGAIVGVWQLGTNRIAKNHRIAFGPFLIIAGFITYVWGLPLFNAIMRLWGVV